jgi:hypothetical protein
VYQPVRRSDSDEGQNDRAAASYQGLQRNSRFFVRQSSSTSMRYSPFARFVACIEPTISSQPSNPRTSGPACKVPTYRPVAASSVATFEAYQDKRFHKGANCGLPRELRVQSSQQLRFAAGRRVQIGAGTVDTDPGVRGAAWPGL